MRNYELSHFGENDKLQEGEETRDTGRGDPKATKAQKEDLRRRIDALSGENPETKTESADKQTEISPEEDLRRRLDALSRTQERSRVIQKNEQKLAEELSKKFKEQTSEQSGI